MYREQEYVERCFCDAAATAPCASCGRARCPRHLARGLCNRCTQAVGREYDARTGARWLLAGATGVAFAITVMVLQLAALSLVGLPLAIIAGVTLGWHQRRRLIRQLGPIMSASKGELPEPPRTYPESPSRSSGLPPGAGPIL